MTESQGVSNITSRQWLTVCFCEEFWGEYKSFPTLEQIKAGVEGFKNTEEVEQELFSTPVRSRLKNRGVDYSARLKKTDPDWKNPSRLSDKQLAVINALLNPFDKRSQTKKLAEMGITPVHLHGWMKDKRFRDYYNARAEELFGPEGMPIAHEALLRKVGEGNLSAIKLYYEMTGRHTGVRREEVTNLKLMFARFTEILQRYVTPDTMRLIITELNNAMALSGAINDNQMALRASPVAESSSYVDDDSSWNV